MLKQALINVEELDIRVAILEDGALVELFVEDLSSKSKVGNIYKGRVEGIVPSLKAVFVNIGTERNAFLHFSDVLPEYDLPQRGRPERLPRSTAKNGIPETTGEPEEEELDEDEYIDPLFLPPDEEWPLEESEAPVARTPRRSKPLHVGDEILLQVTKDEIHSKGPRVTTFVTLPGRYLVYMPCVDHDGGVSRRIEDPGERRRLRNILQAVKPEQGTFIIRTAGLDQNEAAIQEDAERLMKTWGEVVRRTSRCRAPSCIYDDQEILLRVVRDNFSDDLDEILIDSKPSMRRLYETCQKMVPSLCDRIHLYDSAANIFDTFEVEKQFQKALRRKVWLRSGGVIVIDETEALTAIDVNSGKYVGHDDQDQLILKTNLEACHAVARQLRLRDLGGLIVIDFIDMTSRDHDNQVIREFKRCLRDDRAKYSISGISEFGLVEMTRKRVRMSLARAYYTPCPYCEGKGRILSDAQLWKQLKYDLIEELETKPSVDSVDIVVHSQLKTYLQEKVLEALKILANRYRVALNIVTNPEFHREQIKIVTQVKSGHRANEEGSSVSDGRRRKTSQKKLESRPSAQDNAPK